jgi:hypothetical protein
MNPLPDGDGQASARASRDARGNVGNPDENVNIELPACRLAGRKPTFEEVA